MHYFASLMWKCQQEMHTSSQDFFVSSISAKGCHEKRVSCSHTGKRGTLAHMNAESIFRLCFLSVYKHARTNTTSFVPISIRCRTKSHVVVVTDVDIDRCLISFSGRPDCDSERRGSLLHSHSRIPSRRRHRVTARTTTQKCNDCCGGHSRYGGEKERRTTCVNAFSRETEKECSRKERGTNTQRRFERRERSNKKSVVVVVLSPLRRKEKKERKGRRRGYVSFNQSEQRRGRREDEREGREGRPQRTGRRKSSTKKRRKKRKNPSP